MFSFETGADMPAPPQSALGRFTGTSFRDGQVVLAHGNTFPRLWNSLSVLGRAAVLPPLLSSWIRTLLPLAADWRETCVRIS